VHDDATQLVGPAYPIPPHWPYFCWVPVPVGAVTGLVVVGLTLVVVGLITLVLELGGGTGAETGAQVGQEATGPPLMLEIPDHCSIVGTSGWISGIQTVSYNPGWPPAAKLPGSREPNCAPSVQQGLLVPQNGPAAQAVHPMYSGF